MTTAAPAVGATARLHLDRAQILAHRRRVSALDERLPPGADSLRHAAWAGLQDSMPRAALLSIHARVAGTEPTVLDDPALVQLWGPRWSAFAVAADDRAVFTLGRLFDNPDRRQFAEDIADRIESFLDGRAMSCTPVGRALDIHPNMLRYAAPTGRVLINWDGARQPTIWTVPRPDVDPRDARIELARRYLHVFGPTTATGFAEWAGLKPARRYAAFDALSGVAGPGANAARRCVDPRRRRGFVPLAGLCICCRPPPAERRHLLPASGERIASCSFRRPTVAARCGPHACGQAASSSVASSSGPGGAPTRP